MSFTKRILQFGQSVMSVKKVSPSKFSMQFLMDGNVLLVECPGREAQLFMPVLKGNGIIMKNIIFVNKSGSLNSSTKSVKKLPKTSINLLTSPNSYGGSDKVNAESSSNNPLKAISFRCLRNELFDEYRKAGGKSTDKKTPLIPRRRINPKVFPPISGRPSNTRTAGKQLTSGSSQLKKLRGPTKTNCKIKNEKKSHNTIANEKKISPTYDAVRGTFRLGANYLNTTSASKLKTSFKNRVERKYK